MKIFFYIIITINLLGCNSISHSEAKVVIENTNKKNIQNEVQSEKKESNPRSKNIKSKKDKNRNKSIVRSVNIINNRFDTVVRTDKNGYYEKTIRIACIKNEIKQQCIDTVYKFIYDTILTKCKYSQTIGKDTLKVFRDFFDENVCPPNNFTHSKYINYIKKCEMQLPQTKEKILNLFRLSGEKMWDEITDGLKIIGDSTKMDTYKWVAIPTYYLTYNVVMYDDAKDNLIDYFNLDTTMLKYALLEDGLLKLLVYNINGVIDFTVSEQKHLWSIYNEIKKMKRIPIALSLSFMSQTKKGLPPSEIMDFVYAKNKQFIYVSKTEEKFGHYNMNDKTEKIELVRTFKVASESALQCDKDTQKSNLIARILNSEYENLIEYQKNNKPLSP